MLSTITGKTIYILGAGSSHHSGAPLLRDFLLKARLLRERNADLKYKDAFDRTFKWIDSLRAASYYVELDLDNLEHIFSLAEMQKQIGIEDGEQHFSDLRYVVMETLDTCQVRWAGKRYEPDDLYVNFITTLQAINNDRQRRIRDRSSFNKDTIITLNYDVMLDYAMNFHGIQYNYCLDNKSEKDSYKLLKLHGSTNWAHCKHCDNALQIVTPRPLAHGRMHIGIEDGQQVPFLMVTSVLPNIECNTCKEKGNLEPVVIPPTWSKAVSNTPLANVWKQVVAETSTVFQIVVIGYSMPPTDTFFQYILTLGLSLNANLFRVVIINNDGSNEFKQRYEKVFSRSLIDRGRLNFYSISFEEFVRDKMASIGSNIEQL
jgi:hypothetical protein